MALREKGSEEPLESVEDSRVLSGDRLRKTAEYVLYGMRDRDWRNFKKLAAERLNHPSLGDDLKIAELFYRRGYTVNEIDAEKHGFGISTASETKNRKYEFLNYLVGDGEMRKFILARESELAIVPEVTRERLHWTAVRMTDGERGELIGLIPRNMMLENRVRDRQLAEDYFGAEMTADELAQKYMLGKNAVKTLIGKFLDGWRSNPRARVMVQDAVERLESVPPLTEEQVREVMFDLNKEEVAEVFSRLHRSTWKKPEAMDDHIWTAGIFLLDREDLYSRTQKATGYRASRVQNAVEGVVKRISEEPDARAVLIRYVEDIHELREKYGERFRKHWEATGYGTFKPTGEVIETLQPKVVGEAGPPAKRPDDRPGEHLAAAEKTPPIRTGHDDVVKPSERKMLAEETDPTIEELKQLVAREKRRAARQRLAESARGRGPGEPIHLPPPQEEMAADLRLNIARLTKRASKLIEVVVGRLRPGAERPKTVDDAVDALEARKEEVWAARFRDEGAEDEVAGVEARKRIVWAEKHADDAVSQGIEKGMSAAERLRLIKERHRLQKERRARKGQEYTPTDDDLRDLEEWEEDVPDEVDRIKRGMEDED